MKKTLLVFAILFIFQTVTLLNAQWTKATEYHVAFSGNDSNPGSLSNPWRTVQHAADSVTPGDTVFIHNGTNGVSSSMIGGWEGSTPLLRILPLCAFE